MWCPMEMTTGGRGCCENENCAWWYKGLGGEKQMCVIQAIAYCLRDIKINLGEAKEEKKDVSTTK